MARHPRFETNRPQCGKPMVRNKPEIFDDHQHRQQKGGTGKTTIATNLAVAGEPVPFWIATWKSPTPSLLILSYIAARSSSGCESIRPGAPIAASADLPVQRDCHFAPPSADVSGALSQLRGCWSVPKAVISKTGSSA
jgi:hypothetical protein